MNSLFTINGEVIKGVKRGKSLGYPTANIKIEQQIPEGVYVSEAIVDGTIYQAATFIGIAKTFGDTEYKAESYILNFSHDIYGKQITITLFKKLRDNIRFDSEDKLVKQIEIDVLQTRQYFKIHNL
jgi:riboflavin kinase / FMN adenylyltransferase